MDLVQSSLATLQLWGTYFSYCIGQLFQAPVCEPVWTWGTVALLGLGALIINVTAWKIASYRRKLAAALRVQQERTRVDHEAIAARSWDGDKAYSAELGGKEIEKRIREAVDQRRATHPPLPELAPPDRDQ